MFTRAHKQAVLRRISDNLEMGKNMFDYEKQVGINDGKYQRCGHPETMNCKCYGKEHEGETAIITEHCH